MQHIALAWSCSERDPRAGAVPVQEPKAVGPRRVPQKKETIFMLK